MNRSLLLLMSAVLFLAVLPFPLPAPLSADGILPDGCLGNLSPNQVVVYYFHRKFRCQSCEVLESTLKDTLQVSYADHFNTGRLAMCVVNVDDPENTHYLDKFEIFSNTVIIAEKKGGKVSRYKPLDAIWAVSEDREAISHLLLSEVAGFLPES